MVKKITALLVLVLLCCPVQAEEGWQLREVRRAQGSLDYCVIDRAYADGRHLNLARDPDGRMNLGFVLPGAAFPQRRFTVRLALDGAKAQIYPAHAAGPDQMLVDLPAAKNFAASLTRSARLTLQSGPKPQQFKLGGLAEAMAGLEECAAQQDRALPPATLDVLQRAGLGDGLEMVPAAQGVNPMEFLWRRNGLNGGMRHFEAGQDFKNAVRGQLAVLRNYCRGLWSEDLGLILVLKDGARQQQGVLSCAGGEHEEMMAVLFHADAAGGQLYSFAGRALDRSNMADAINALAKALAMSGPNVSGKP